MGLSRNFCFLFKLRTLSTVKRNHLALVNLLTMEFGFGVIIVRLVNVAAADDDDEVDMNCYDD